MDPKVGLVMVGDTCRRLRSSVTLGTACEWGHIDDAEAPIYGQRFDGEGVPCAAVDYLPKAGLDPAAIACQLLGRDGFLPYSFSGFVAMWHDPNRSRHFGVSACFMLVF